MGLYDWYEPDPPLRSPTTQRFLTGWQGKDGPCALLVWRQRQRFAVGMAADEEVRLGEEDLKQFNLPETFTIYAQDSESFYFARCQSVEGIWLETRLE